MALSELSLSSFAEALALHLSLVSFPPVPPIGEFPHVLCLAAAATLLSEPQPHRLWNLSYFLLEMMQCRCCCFKTCGRFKEEVALGQALGTL